MSWDTTKVSGDIISSADYNSGIIDQKTRAIRTTGSGVPSSAPANIGDIYVDTTNNKFYIAMGTSSSSDWKKVLSQ